MLQASFATLRLHHTAPLLPCSPEGSSPAVKQVGMSGVCYPDSLIASTPNLYYYAANNPSEATIAKRRSYANTISYLTPPAENAGLYKGLKVRAGYKGYDPTADPARACGRASNVKCGGTFTCRTAAAHRQRPVLFHPAIYHVWRLIFTPRS